MVGSKFEYMEIYKAAVTLFTRFINNISYSFRPCQAYTFNLAASTVYHNILLYLPSACMRKRVTVVTLSVRLSVCHCVCHFFILEKTPFSGLKLISVQSR